MSFGNRYLFFAGLLICLLSSGCGGSEAHPPTAKVSGTVSFQGAPLESGTIMFFPVAGGKHAVGMIKDGGAFSLSTFESEDGALIGDHKVVLNISYEQPDGQPVPASVKRVPKKYADRETTPLSAQVKADGENQFTFEVTP